MRQSGRRNHPSAHLFTRVTKYYFDLVNGAVHHDKIGAELTDDGAAKQEALMRALVETSHQIARYA